MGREIEAEEDTAPRNRGKTDRGRNWAKVWVRGPWVWVGGTAAAWPHSPLHLCEALTADGGNNTASSLQMKTRAVLGRGRWAWAKASVGTAELARVRVPHIVRAGFHLLEVGSHLPPVCFLDLPPLTEGAVLSVCFECPHRAKPLLKATRGTTKEACPEEGGVRKVEVEDPCLRLLRAWNEVLAGWNELLDGKEACPEEGGVRKAEVEDPSLHPLQVPGTRSSWRAAGWKL